MRERRNEVPLVVAETENGGEASAFVGLGPLPNFLKFGWVEVNAVF